MTNQRLAKITIENTLQSKQISELLESKFLVINDGYRAKNEELSETGSPFAGTSRFARRA